MKTKFILYISIFLLICSVMIGGFLLKKPVKSLSYPDFIAAVEDHQVQEVIMTDTGNTFQIKLKDNPKDIYKVPHPKTEDFTEFLLINDIAINYGNPAVGNVFRVLLVAGIAAAIIIYSRKGSGKSMVEDVNRKKNKSSLITLDQVAGNAEAKAMVEDIIGFIQNPEQYTSLGARMPKGLLFYGPPGTGKTLMARAIAGQAQVPFYSMSGSDFVQMYVGVGASRIRNLFRKAKKSSKAVIFIDEIDAIGKKRARSANASNDERDQTLNALLTEMSGFHENQGIVVIGATNRIDTLDEALLRPGRFDRQIEIGLPDIHSRKKILTLHSSNKPLSDDIDLDEIAKSTVYFSGAMLENLMNEAAILAANEKSAYIRQSNIDRAFYTVLAGAPKTDYSFISDRDRKITAYHEAGHALATKLLLPENHVSKVTIIPSVRGAGGFNLSIPKDTLYQSQRQMIGNIQVLLAGRAAEQLIFGKNEITTGAGNDIQKASSMILDYMNKYGMDEELGLFSMEVLEDRFDNQLISKCRSYMNTLYDQTMELLSLNQNLLEDITASLLEKESLNNADLDRIIDSAQCILSGP